MRKGLVMKSGGAKTNQSEKERRRHERYPVAFDLRVYLLNEDRLLGEVTDISLGGMTLKCEEPVVIGRHYGLRMLTSLESLECEAVSFEARCLRSGRDDVSACEKVAFEFQNLSTHALQSIDIIVAELST
jgi:c-di-GMP-binding flagellar brake protein YcgR